MDLTELFRDLEQQLGTELDLEIRDQLTDEERQRQARLSLRERIRLMGLPRGISATEPISMTLTGGTQLQVSPMTLGRDWVAADVQTSMGLITHAIIPLAAISSLQPTPAQLARSLGDPVTSISRDDEASMQQSKPRLTDQIGVPYVLRDLARRRKPVEVVVLGSAHDRGQSSSKRGILDRVGSDHVDLLRGERVEVIPINQLQLVYLM
jgi:hypothetical protein